METKELFSNKSLTHSLNEINRFYKEIAEISEKIINKEKEKGYPIDSTDLDINDELDTLLKNINLLMESIYIYYYKIESNIKISTGQYGFEEALMIHWNRKEKLYEGLSMFFDTRKINYKKNIIKSRKNLEHDLSRIGVDLLNREKIVKSFWEKDVLFRWADEQIGNKFEFFFHSLRDKFGSITN